jgi:4-amino-4-deoxy-L-arabinose transferase-like glycosyltransferase
VLGLAALTRPVGQVIMAVLPLAFLLHYRAWRPMLKAFALALACFALVVVPWAVRNQVVYGTAGAASIGRFLISRSVKHERNFVFYQADVGAYPGESAQRARARAIAQEVTDKRPEPGQIFQRVRDELRLTESQTDAMLKDIALEAILRDPMLWVDGTIGMFFALIEGAPKEELVHWHWEVHDQPRVSNQWGRLNYLLAPLSESQTREMGRAESLAMIFRPSQHTGVLVVLFLVGSAFAVVRRPLSPVILPALVVVVLIAGSAALVGDVPRYRYPIDPLIYVIAAGGLTSLVGMLAAGVRRLSRKQLSFGGGVASQPAK